MEKQELYEYIIERGIASEETVNAITNINGYTIEALNDLLFSITGYHTIEQLQEATY